MSRYFGLILLCAFSAGCGADTIDALSAAELNGTWSTTRSTNPADAARQQPTTAAQCQLNVTAHVNPTTVVDTYSTFACEGTPSDFTARR